MKAAKLAGHFDRWAKNFILYGSGYVEREERFQKRNGCGMICSSYLMRYSLERWAKPVMISRPEILRKSFHRSVIAWNSLGNLLMFYKLAINISSFSSYHNKVGIRDSVYVTP